MTFTLRGTADTHQPAAVITSLGHYLPEKVISSHEVEARVAAAGWPIPSGLIRRLSGVEHRHFAEDGDVSSDLAARAGRIALQRANADPSSVDVMIFAAASHDIAEPATANVVQEKIGCMLAHTFDVKNACNSFLNALDVANSFIATGRARRILITSGEVLSAVINWEVKDLADLKLKFAALTLGDGGGACLVDAAPDLGRGLYPGRFFSNGRHWRLSTVLSGGTLMKGDSSKSYFECDTDELQALALEELSELIPQVLAELRWHILDVKLVVPHQASVSITRRICEVLDYPLERCALTVRKFGNIAAASIPVALSLAVEEGRVASGDKLLLVGAAAGFSAAVIPVIM